MAYVLHRTSCCRSMWESKHNKKDLPVGIPNNVIKYTASEKLAETTTKPYPTSGLKTDAFSGSSGQRLTMKSHTFENGIGTIEFDGDIASIDKFAFYGCSELTSVTIPNSVTNIGCEAFNNCTSLTSIAIPNSVTSIDVGAFSNVPWYNAYSADTSHHYGNIIYINDIAYKATTTTISSCIFREGTVSISGSAFNGCTSLTSVTIPDSVTSIGNNAFDGCSSLTSVTIPNNVTSISKNIFSNCAGLTSVTIPDGVISIGMQAFNNCTSLTSIEIPNSVTSIDSWAFNGCTSLTSVTIPDSVTSIGSCAFRNCSGLTSVTIGSNVTNIGASAFQSCSRLISIVSNAVTAPTIQNTTFQYVKTDGTLTVSSGSTGYDTWMGTGNYYLGLCNWSKVEQ